MTRKLLGYQMADHMGENIQGDDNDPSGHPSFYVLNAAEAWRVLEDNPDHGLLLMPIYEGDVENPSFAGD